MLKLSPFMMTALARGSLIPSFLRLQQHQTDIHHSADGHALTPPVHHNCCKPMKEHTDRLLPAVISSHHCTGLSFAG
jgi:hypothetical protein